jgi:heme-degrading monooxygenase HmoA
MIACFIRYKLDPYKLPAAFSQRERFIREEGRLFLRLASAPHASEPGKLLSLSFWRDETAVARWRSSAAKSVTSVEWFGM